MLYYYWKSYFHISFKKFSAINHLTYISQKTTVFEAFESLERHFQFWYTKMDFHNALKNHIISIMLII